MKTSVTQIPKTKAPAVNVTVHLTNGESFDAQFSESFTVGRGDVCDLVLEEELVSKVHLMVQLIGEKWHVEDADSTNGVVQNGKEISDADLTGILRIRLGHKGPLLVFKLDGVEETPEPDTTAVKIGAADMARKYFSGPTENAGESTQIIQLAFQQTKTASRKRWGSVVLTVVIIAAILGSISFYQNKQIAEQRAIAEELFYKTKDLELAISTLGESEEVDIIRKQISDQQKRYQDYLKALGVYDENTSEEDKLIYEVIHLFGESELNVPPEFIEEIHTYIRQWQNATRLQTSLAVAAENEYGSKISIVMLENNMPPEYFYLALMESDFETDAIGPRTRFGIAKGMWQFLPGTAREYGMRTGPLVGNRQGDPVDDRQDFGKSTKGAAEYLRDLYRTDAQASGLLAMASYNWGRSNVLRFIRTLPKNPRERNFWKLVTVHRKKVPEETYDYVLKIVSATVIGRNPALFGFDFAPPLG